MKKTILVVLCILFIVALFGCSSDPTSSREITLNLPTGDVTGAYVGDTEKGIPHGVGTFTYANGETPVWTYTGEWETGLMSGKGKCEWDNGRVYDGEYYSGYMHGTGSVYENNSLLYTGIYDSGKLVGLVREKITISDNEKRQYVRVGTVGFQIPEKWTYTVVDDKIAHIEIPGADNVSIIFSISDYIDFSKDTNRTTVKQKYVSEYGDSYTEYMISAESSGLLADPDEYDVQLTFLNDENVMDVYSHSISRTPLLATPTTYTVTTVIKGGAYDYSETAECVTYTMKGWEYIEEDIKEQEAEEDKQNAQQFLEGTVDWDGLATVATKVTQAEVFDRTCPKNSLVLIEGIISDITASDFNLWLPHNESYFKEEDWNYNIDLGDITEGDTVEICIETHSDGSLKQSEGILAIRKLNVSPVEDIVALFKNTCKTIDYKAIMRNPDQAYGTIWKAQGKVFQVVKTESYMQEFLLELSDGNIVYVSYYKDAQDDNILEGDRISIYGTFYMTKTYMTVLGGEKTVPKLVADYLDFN